MPDLSTQIREGMQVYTADGASLGNISQVWYGDTAGSVATSEQETCMEVHRGFLGREVTYIPCHAVEDVSNDTVKLNVDEQTAEATPSWHIKPSWIE